MSSARAAKLYLHLVLVTSFVGATGCPMQGDLGVYTDSNPGPGTEPDMSPVTGDAPTTVEATEPGTSTMTEGATEPGTSTTTTEGATEPGTSTTTTEGATEPGTSTASETETDGEPVCPCILPEEEGGWGDEPALPICGEPVCPTVEIGNAPTSPCDESVKEGSSVPLMNPEALACALTALRDRTPGIIGWDCGDHSGDMFSDSGYVLIGADGTAIRRHWGAYDLSWTVWRAEQGALPDPDVFEQCLASRDDATRWECLRNFLLGEPILVCDPLWGVSQG